MRAFYCKDPDCTAYESIMNAESLYARSPMSFLQAFTNGHDEFRLDRVPDVTVHKEGSLCVERRKSPIQCACLRHMDERGLHIIIITPPNPRGLTR
jgi:3-polyprenyl-4-hydroxybenzoate decarboxylase